MSWIDPFYSTSVALQVSVAILAMITVLSWRQRGRQIILALTLLLYARYLVWRGLYTLNLDSWSSSLISGTVLLAEVYGFFHLVFFAFQAWNPMDRKSPLVTTYRTVDIFVTIVNEPLHILRQTLLGCTNQDYPSDKYKVSVLDDGNREDVRQLAESLGCGYIRRQDRTHAKAGNLNHALQHTTGELVAVFDTDHVPAPSFLKDTLGFFEHNRVALVQTPHHFYNPDIFQRNLQIESHLVDEQRLFFRTLQPGRDAHNSAFFAGSCGVLRRQALLEIGGFQTETITEDIHTSMILHAHGWESRYLNKVLASGLNAESFGGYLKQRTRWAMGSIQMFFIANPLRLRGLTLLQRIDYFASVYYFLHAIPRLVCIVAPLSALLFSVAPVRATAESMAIMFGSYYLASLVMLSTISRGTRNPFWGDVYETAVCFRLSKAALKAILRPRRPRAFVVTPKGENTEEHCLNLAANVVPHLVILGTLFAGVTVGITSVLRGVALPGLEVSIFWAAVNIVFLVLAINAANDLPQWRKVFRIPLGDMCEVSDGNRLQGGRLVNVSEHGICVRIEKPIMTGSNRLTLFLQNADGAKLEIKGLLVRQRQAGSLFELGMSLVAPNEAAIKALHARMFSCESVSSLREEAPAGIWQSLGALLIPLMAAWRSRSAAWRTFLSRSRRRVCAIELEGKSYSGLLQSAYSSGITIIMNQSLYPVFGAGVVTLNAITMKVELVGINHVNNRQIALFRVMSLEQGADEWRALASSSEKHVA